VYGTDWERKEVLDEMKSVVAGLAIITGIVVTGYFILQKSI